MPAPRKLGTFAGVFTPSIMTILGVILYLRLPAIVGQAGLWTTLGIIALAHLISFTTGLSVASVATDRKVQAGGTYYMLSRSLGLPIGGTLGIALFVGLSFSVSMYLIGFADALLRYWGIEPALDLVRLTAAAALLVLAVVTIVGTALAMRLQFVIMAVMALSIVSIALGSHAYTPEAPHLAPLPDAPPFIALFAIFFPAVTGFEAGVAMSGDLRDPKRSLPAGALAAIAAGFAVYVGLAIFLAYTVGADQLAANPNVLFDIALSAPVVAVGIWLSTLSSGLGSLMAAPRILQATSADGITPTFFARGHGREREPRRALAVSFAIALAGIAIGELDTVARIVSMFFIASYGFLNLSCAIENWASPDFRPEFRVPTAVSIVGAAACLIVMIEIDVVAMFGASIVLGALFLVLQRRELRLESGDAWDGFWSSVARSALHRLDRNRVHHRNWLPNILLFGGAEGARPELVELGRQIAASRGILSNFDLVEHPGAPARFLGGVEPKDDSERAPFGMFARRVECADVYDGMETLARFYGFAGVQPNTVLLGWGRDAPDPSRFAALVGTLTDLDYNVLLFARGDRGQRAAGMAETHADRRIDIWWRGVSANAQLALALVGHLTASDAWRTADIRFLVVADDGMGSAERLRRELTRRIDESRVRASIKVLGQISQRDFGAVMRTESGDAALTIVGMPPPAGSDPAAWVERTTALLDGLGPVLLVQASSFFREAETPKRPAADVRLPAAALDHLPPLPMPAEPALAGPIADVDARVQEMAKRFGADCLTAVYAPHVAMVTHIVDDVTGAIEELERTTDVEGHRALRRVRKAQGDLLFRVRRTLSAYGSDDVPAQAAILADGVTGLLAEAASLAAALPSRINVQRQVPALTTRLQGPPGARLQQLAQQVLGTFTGGVVTHRIPFGTVVRDRLAHDAAILLQSVLHGFGTSSYHAVADAARLIDAARSALDRIETAVETGTDLPEAVRAAAGGLPGECTRVVETHRAECARAVALLHQGLRDTTAAIASSAIDAGRQTIRADHRAVEALRDWPRAWSEAQTLVVHGADLDAHLLALRHRIAVIVERARQALQLDFQNGVFARVEELRKAVAAFLVEAERDEEAEFTRRFDAWPAFDPQAVVSGLLEELRLATDALPAQIDTIGSDAMEPLESGRVELIEPVTVSLRRLAEYRIESELMAPLQERLTRVPAAFDAVIDAARDTIRLTTVRLAPSTSTETVDRCRLVRGGLERLDDAVGDLQTLARDVDRSLIERLDTTLELLSSYGVMHAEGAAERYRRAARSRQALSRFGAEWRRVRQAAVDASVALLQRRSEAVLLTRRLEAQADRRGLDDLRELVQAVSPASDVLAALPFHYRQLFLGGVSFTRDAWFGWEDEERRAAEIVEDHRHGLPGGLLILGEQGAGKTSLLQHLSATHVADDRRFILPAPAGGTPDAGDLMRRLCAMCGVSPETPDPLAAVPAGSAVLIDDLDRWWERSEAGLGTLRAVIDMMSRHASRLLFMATADRQAFRLIDAIERLAPHFIGVIECRPLNARHLAEAISFRHESAGLTFMLDGVPESALSALQRARLFNRMFDYTHGRIGDALHAWIAHIRHVSGDELTIEPPARPDLTPLERLSTVQTALLVQILLHRGLEFERLARLAGGLDAAALRREIDALRRTGVIRERTGGSLAVNSYLRPHLVRAFVDKGVLPE